MNENPYAAPRSIVDRVRTPEVPEKVLAKIRRAWIAAVVSGCATFIAVLVSIYGTSILGIGLWELIDVALAFGLAYGIYRKSRACAVIMLVYYVASKILLIVEMGKPRGIGLALIFIYFFVQGVVGTFQYQQIARGPVSRSKGRTWR